MEKNEREGLLWMLFSAAGSAFIPVLVKTLYNHSTLEPMDVAIWRFAFGVPLIWALVFLRHKTHSYKKPQQVPIVQELALGVVFAISILALFHALERLPGGLSITLFHTYPLMVVLLSVFIGERIPLKAWLALPLVLVGVILTVPQFMLVNADYIVGIGFTFVSGAVIAIYYLVEKRILTDVEDVSGASAFMVTGTLIPFLLWIPVRGLQFPQDSTELLLLLGIASIGTVFPIFAVNLGIQKLGASQASLLGTSEVVMSMIASMILLGEIILPAQWLGASLIIVGVIVLEVHPRHRIDFHIHFFHKEDNEPGKEYDG